MNLRHFILSFALSAVFCGTVAASPADSVAAVGASATETAAPSGVSLTLDDCLRIALSESPTVKVADMEITRVDYSKKNVLAELLPQISFGGQYNRMLAKQVAYMNMSGFGGMGGNNSGSGDSGSDTPGDSGDTTPETPAPSAGQRGIKMGLDNSFQMGFSASMPLVAPQLWASMKLSDAQILQAVEQARASRLDLIAQVKQAYYTLLLAKDSKKVIQESYDMAALTYDIYSKRFAAGDASEYDVLRTSVAMKNVEPQLLQADIAIRQARLQLMLLMGVDARADYEFAGELSAYEKTMYDDVMALPTDYSQNTQLIQNTLAQNTLDQAVRVNKMAWYPTLALTASYNWTSSSDGSPFKNFRWNPYSVVGLNLSIPLFTGGRRHNNIKMAQIQATENMLQRENIEHNVSMQAKLAVDNIHLNVRQIASCAESVKQADRAYNIMSQSFDIGAASYLNLRDSELALTQSRLTYFQAIYNYLVATNDLELLLGTADTGTK